MVSELGKVRVNQGSSGGLQRGDLKWADKDLLVGVYGEKQGNSKNARAQHVLTWKQEKPSWGLQKKSAFLEHMWRISRKYIWETLFSFQSSFPFLITFDLS